MKRYPTTSFVSEFQKSLSIVDYIDVDLGDEMPIDDDPLESVKYLFSQSTNRRLPRRTTNVSSISTDSGYSDQTSSTKLVPVQILSCSLIPVNVRCLTCTCHQRKYSSNRSICNHKSHSTMTIYPTKFVVDVHSNKNWRLIFFLFVKLDSRVQQQMIWLRFHVGINRISKGIEKKNTYKVILILIFFRFVQRSRS